MVKRQQNITHQDKEEIQGTHTIVVKFFWDKVSELLRAGYDSHTAIDKIYEVYNNQSVTQIINHMRRDKVNGGHPLLRV